MRRTTDVTITAEGRDKGKVFRLTELPADEAEEWAMRAVLALANNGVDIPEEVMSSPSLAGLAFVGTKALGRINANEAIPLLKTMMSCIQIVTDVGVARALVEGQAADIEEIATRLHLRVEVISLHVGFSILGAITTMRGQMAAKMETKPRKTSGRTKTSRPR